MFAPLLHQPISALLQDKLRAVMPISSRVVSLDSKLANLVFWLVAAILLFWGLGDTGMWNSEDRWMEVAREMRLSGNYFEPMINGVVYFDKPLGSYWLVVLFSFVTGGVNEWALRLPSALCGLLSLWATIDLGKRLWSLETGRLAGWLLLTSYGLLMWGRSGEADMENMAASILAVAWYWRTRSAPNFFSYFVFYLIIFIGAQTKGLTAAVVPMLALACDIFRTGRWRAHLNVTHVLAALAGSIVYVLPFLLAQTPASGGAGEAGLMLVFRENVVRYFAPFDHDAPFYMYFLWLPVLMLPWLPLLGGGIASIFINYKSQNAVTHWLIAAFTAIFLFFLLSGSRRIYYILPLLPYCALLIALFLRRDDLQRLRDILLRIQIAFLLFVIGVLLALPALLPRMAARAHLELPADLSLRSVLVIGALAALYWLSMTRSTQVQRVLFGTNQRVAVLFGVAALLLGGFFLQIRVLQDGYRTEWPFARELKALAEPLPVTQMASFGNRMAGGLLYYGELPPGITVFQTAAELLQFAQTPPYPKLIIASTDDFAQLPSELVQLPPTLSEHRQPWEKASRDKLRAWLLESAPQ